ncbi:MAG: hypothetical protein V1894_04410 [Chloroflexota bacterium]
MARRILYELREHIPFTALGALSGIIILVIIMLTHTPQPISETLFYFSHPLHVLLSSLVTTAMYRKYGSGRWWQTILIGYLGTVIPATLSDVIIPYLGGSLLRAQMEFELPFIDAGIMPVFGIAKWQIVNLMALIGIAIGYLKPLTKIPHAGHVFLSTWASLFYFTAFGLANWLSLLPLVFIFLFLAVWLPCCLSDIVFPLFFVPSTPKSKGVVYNT